MSQCKLCYAIQTTSEKDQLAIASVFKRRDITNTDLAHILSSNGFPISEASVRRHIKGEH